MLRLLFVVLILTVSCFSFANGMSSRFSHISTEQGLTLPSVLGMVQDKKGFMWFVTGAGLNRYDGYDVKVFSHDVNDPDSLSNNLTSALFEDSKGRLWVGTYGGLNRYDAVLERFVRYQLNGPGSLASQDIIISIGEDDRQVVWIGTAGGGLYEFDEQLQKFNRFVHDDKNPNSLSNNVVNAIHADGNGGLWLGTFYGLNHLDIANKRFRHYFHQGQDPDSLSHNIVHALEVDDQGMLWVGSQDGLNRFDQNTGQFTRFNHSKDDRHSLSDNYVRSLLQDSTGQLWVGTHSGGVNVFDAETGHFTSHHHDIGDPYSMSNDDVTAIVEDRQGLIWIGTLGGANVFNRVKQNFGHVWSKINDPLSLSHNDVWGAIVDSKGDLWVGSHKGLDKYDKTVGGFINYSHNPNDANSLSHDRASAIFEDANGELWVGTYGGGLNRFDAETEQFSHYRHDVTNPASISSNDVMAVFEDSRGKLWIGTFGGGLNLFDRQSQTFTRFVQDPSNSNSLSNNFIYTIYEAADGALWITTLDGLNRFDVASGQFTVYRHLPSNANSLSSNTTTSILQDSDNIFWVGTTEGLNRFDASLEQFSHYGVKQGLVSELITGLVADDQGYLWMSTNDGLSRFDPNNQAFVNFDTNDGLQGNMFNFFSYKSADGELFFGGKNGFNRFNPQDINNDMVKPKVVLTDFLLANQSVAITPKPQQSASAQFTLPKSIDEISQLNLSYKQNLISFEFTTLDFSNPMKVNYAYQLQGWDKQWVYTDATKRWATYTNIPAGEYSLKIKAANAQGFWHDEFKSIDIIITPPPWKTWWAYLIYVGTAIFILLWFFHNEHKKVLYERDVNQRLKQVDKLKDEFLANTSHELRTPLNGIIGLAESLQDGVGGQQSDVSKENLALIISSGKRLSNLINDVLDFSKLKNSKLALKLNPVDLSAVVKVVLALSKPLVGDKKIKLVNAISPDIPPVMADTDRLQQVLLNLIGNAIKFTEAGEVSVSAECVEHKVIIRVKDTGIGIAEDKLGSIFESFEQLQGDDTRSQSGTGLGLSVSKQLVELHHSQLSVQSTLGEGSTFSFFLAVSEVEPAVNELSNQAVARLHLMEQEHTIAIDSPQHTLTNQINGQPVSSRILVVDDELVNRKVLFNHLSLKNYELVEAADGKEAIKAIDEQGPFDLILLDIMMPNMSGYEVCSQLRQSYSSNDLPVLFLTAKNQVADMVHSFEVGANDYLSKPISKHELLTRVESHLKFLDIHRNLETKVKERTLELEQKNQQILQAQQQLVHSEKMVSLGTLTAGVAHEINNPNNFVYVSSQNLEADLIESLKYFLELAGDGADAEIVKIIKAQFEPLNEHSKVIKQGSERIKSIVDDLKTFAQLDLAEQNTVVMTDLLQSTVNLIKTQYESVIQFSFNFTSTPALYCYPAQLNQVFMNLISNACYAVQAAIQSHSERSKGEIIIGCHQQDGMIEISITDNGSGMNEETQNKLFEPFFTTKEIGKGTGLGLSIAFGIVQKHGGELSVESQLDIGSTFYVRLPLTVIERNS